MAAGSGTGTRAGRRLSLKARALAFLAQREHSAAELRRKLLRHARRQVDASADAGNGPGAGSDADAEMGEAVAQADEDIDTVARVDDLIDWLRTHRYLSEDRFAESRVHARSARYGNLRIRQELAQHGVALTAQATQALKDSELQRAVQVWQRKFGVPPADAGARAKQARFLAQRGFSPEVVARVLRGAAMSDVPADED